MVYQTGYLHNHIPKCPMCLKLWIEVAFSVYSNNTNVQWVSIGRMTEIKLRLHG